ncbi:MAG TPA: ABC transporter ATP-binding protein [Candidatus Omnitrophica bacterium]|nr:ABC transporter ATP-binding protein [Candidatus Omnitrophota bacterium]
MKSWDFIVEIFSRFPGLMVKNIVLVTVVSLLGACSLFTITPVVDFLIHPDLQGVSPLTIKMIDGMKTLGLPASLTSLLLIVVLFITLGSVLQLGVRHSLLRTKYVVSKDIMLGTFRDFCAARWGFFTSNKQGELINTLTRELSIVDTAFGGMGLLFSGILQLIVFISVPFYISWQVTLISLTIAFVFAVPFVLLGKMNYRLGQLNTSTANQLTSVMHESFNLAKLVLGFGTQETAINHLNSVYDVHIRVTLKSQILSLAVPILYRPLGIIMLVAALFAGRHFAVPLSELTVLLLALTQVAQSIGNITMYKNALENFVPSYEQIQKLRRKAGEMRHEIKDRKFTGFQKAIEIKQLTFSYPGHSPVLTDVDASIAKGQMVAFVGKSGTGKSTLIDLIMGFYEPQQGAICFDGTPLSEFDIVSYRKRVGYVPQDSVLFNMTIRENLLWSSPEASEAEIKTACRSAFADEFIASFPQGYETWVGDRGVRLSGGQIQRIALARALLRKPEVLILDEATSSLDTHSERLIQKAIENIAHETTVIVVAHRLSTIKKADCIYVLDQGRLLEKGTYDELTAQGGYFNSMVRLQELEPVK